MPTLGELAALTGAELRGDPGLAIARVADLAEAGAGCIAPFTDPARLEEARASSAAALLTGRSYDLPQAQLVCADPRRALALLLERFAPTPPPPPRGIDPRAVVEPGACVHPEAWVGPLSYVAAGAEVGEGTLVLPLSYLGEGVRVGRGCRLGPGATLLTGCSLGDGVRVAPGAVLGGEGFGFFRDGEGWHRLRSAAGVRVGAGAEIGAGSCVDRGTLADTRIGAGTKIDNLVQVGHNVSVGERALLCAQVGLAGSVRIEEGCVVGGQVGVADHRRVGAGAQLAAQSGVITDIPDGAQVGGTPAIEHRRWLRASVLFSRLAELSRQVAELRRKLSADSSFEEGRDAGDR